MHTNFIVLKIQEFGHLVDDVIPKNLPKIKYFQKKSCNWLEIDKRMCVSNFKLKASFFRHLWPFK